MSFFKGKLLCPSKSCIPWATDTPFLSPHPSFNYTDRSRVRWCRVCAAAASTRAPLTDSDNCITISINLSPLCLQRFPLQQSKCDVTAVSVHAGSGADQWHAGWDVESRLRVLAVQQAAAGRRPGSRRQGPLRLNRNPRPVCDSGRPKEACLHYGDLHHLQSLHQGLLLAGVMLKRSPWFSSDGGGYIKLRYKEIVLFGNQVLAHLPIIYTEIYCC